MALTCGCSAWHDPGPCPVDDAPHTTCTSPDYQPTAPITVPMGALDRTLVVPVVAPARPSSFTTKTYSREKHGKFIGVRR